MPTGRKPRSSKVAPYSMGYRYDNKGNRLVYSPSQGKWVIEVSQKKSRADITAAARRKTGNQIVKLKDTTRGGMAAGRAGTRPNAKPAAKPSSSDAKPGSSYSYTPGASSGSKGGKESKPVLLGGNKTKTTKPSGGSSSGASSSRRGSSAAGSGRPSSKPSAAGGGRKPAVSQSRTMWVKKGDVVNGKTVKKGYVAQYGKPERKVTNRVRMETGAEKGKTIRYKAGRRVKKK